MRAFLMGVIATVTSFPILFFTLPQGIVSMPSINAFDQHPIYQVDTTVIKGAASLLLALLVGELFHYHDKKKKNKPEIQEQF